MAPMRPNRHSRHGHRLAGQARWKPKVLDDELDNTRVAAVVLWCCQHDRCRRVEDVAHLLRVALLVESGSWQMQLPGITDVGGDLRVRGGKLVGQQMDRFGCVISLPHAADYCGDRT